MGLDISHDCWDGAFGRWRMMIAKVAGISLSLMENFYDERKVQSYIKKTSEGPLQYWVESEVKRFYPYVGRVYNCTYYLIIQIVIAASDCEAIASRLSGIIHRLPLEEGWRETTQRFIDGLRLAASRNENVIFH